MEGYYFKQTCPMIKNLQDRVTEVEKQVVDVDKKTEGYYFKQTCPMIKNLQDRVTVLEK
jgi:hypothetical protein